MDFGGLNGKISGLGLIYKLRNVGKSMPSSV